MKKRKWILVAEDDESMAELTTLALDQDEFDCDVITVRDGQEAMDCLHRRGRFHQRAGSDPAFVLLDVRMPRMDGLEVLRQMKSDVRLKVIPVVMFSSSCELAEVRRCYQSGANGYVVKPTDSRDFTEALERTVRFWVMTNESSLEEEPRSEFPRDVQPRAPTA